MSLLATLKGRLYSAYSQFYVNAFVVEGIQKNSTVPLRMLYFDNSWFMESCLTRIYDSPPTVVSKWKVPFGSLGKLLTAPPAGVDIVMGIAPPRIARRFRAQCKYQSQTSVDEFLCWRDPSSLVQHRLQRRIKKTEALIRQMKLVWESSHSAEDFDFYYEHMYLPFIREKFDKFVHKQEYGPMRKCFEKGLLLKGLIDGKWLIGSIYWVKNGTVINQSLATLEGHAELFRSGIITAAYLFSIEFARQNGVERINLGTSRPFLDDGVYRHKFSWGARVAAPEEPADWILVTYNSITLAVEQFFSNNPLIVQTPAGLMGLIVPSESAPLTLDKIERLQSMHQCPGLNGLLVPFAGAEAPERIPFNDVSIPAPTNEMPRVMRAKLEPTVSIGLEKPVSKR